MKNTVKGILALALMVCCGTVEAAQLEAELIVESRPNTVKGVWVTKTKDSPPVDSDYTHWDHSLQYKAAGSQTFWAYYKVCGDWEFLGWFEKADGSGTVLSTTWPYETSVKAYNAKTIYGHFHEHEFTKYEASGLTIILKCSNGPSAIAVKRCA